MPGAAVAGNVRVSVWKGAFLSGTEKSWVESGSDAERFDFFSDAVFAIATSRSSVQQPLGSS